MRSTRFVSESSAKVSDGHPERRTPGLLPHALVVGLLLAASAVLGFLLRTDGSDPAAPPSLSLASALGGADTTGFARVVEPRPFVFPEDHGAHPEYRTEWWYFTGNLDSEDGRRFGYQLTLFRNALAPVPPAIESEWATRQLYMGHLGITDVRGGTFHGAERFARGAAGLAGVTIRPLRVWLEDWVIEELVGREEWRLARTGLDEGAGAEAEQRVDLGASSVFPLRLQASEGGVAIDLTVEAGKPIVLQGERGYSRKGAETGNASHYYSFTRLPSSGAITLGGRTFQVRGESWLDREWSTSALGEGQVGWDWFALQLEDGTEVMYYQLRGADGSADPFSRGTFVEEDGGYRSLAREEVSLEVQESWPSPLGGRYPSRWRLRIPELALELDVVPVLSDQEHDSFVRYWEGAVDVRGTREGQAVAGRGYVELTGYADERKGGS